MNHHNHTFLQPWELNFKHLFELFPIVGNVTKQKLDQLIHCLYSGWRICKYEM